jgi:hypothetical protein
MSAGNRAPALITRNVNSQSDRRDARPRISAAQEHDVPGSRAGNSLRARAARRRGTAGTSLSSATPLTVKAAPNSPPNRHKGLGQVHSFVDKIGISSMQISTKD